MACPPQAPLPRQNVIMQDATLYSLFDGELKREDDAIVYVSPSAGEKNIERYHVAP